MSQFRQTFGTGLLTMTWMECALLRVVESPNESLEDKCFAVAILQELHANVGLYEKASLCNFEGENGLAKVLRDRWSDPKLNFGKVITLAVNKYIVPRNTNCNDVPFIELWQAVVKSLEPYLPQDTVEDDE